MDQDAKNLWTGVVAGFIIMIFFALISIDVMKFIPILGPFVGGVVAGYIVHKDIMTSGKAGLYAGILTAIVVTLDFMSGLKYMKGATIPYIVGSGFLVLIFTIIIFAFLSFLGGAFGSMIQQKLQKKPSGN
jgi:hypothetical protein